MGEVSCLWRLWILIGLPFRVGGRRTERRARMEITRRRRREIAVRRERKRSGARGMRDTIRTEEGDSYVLIKTRDKKQIGGK
jgi:hypothetical protein